MKNAKPRIHGFTLLEVLVALFVLSLGLLGLAALQMTSLSFNTDAYLRTQATVLVYDIVDKMKINFAGVRNGSYDIATPADADTFVNSTYSSCATSACKCDATECDTTNLARYDLGTWYAKTNEVLPGSADPNKRATIVRNAATGLVTITINWVERDIDKSLQWQIQL